MHAEMVLPTKKKNYVNHCLPQTVIGNKIPHGKVNDYWGKNGAKSIHSVTSDNLGLLCATKLGYGCKDLLRDKSQFSHSPTPSTSLGTGGERDTGAVCHCLGDSDAGIHCLLSWFIGTPALTSMHRDLWVRQLERTSSLQFPTERRVLSLKRKIFTFPICSVSPNRQKCDRVNSLRCHLLEIFPRPQSSWHGLEITSEWR